MPTLTREGECGLKGANTVPRCAFFSHTQHRATARQAASHHQAALPAQSLRGAPAWLLAQCVLHETAQDLDLVLLLWPVVLCCVPLCRVVRQGS